MYTFIHSSIFHHLFIIYSFTIYQSIIYYLFVCLYVHLSVYLSFIYLYVSSIYLPSIYPSNLWSSSIYPQFLYLLIQLPSIHPPTHPSTHIFIHLLAYASTHLPILVRPGSGFELPSFEFLMLLQEGCLCLFVVKCRSPERPLIPSLSLLAPLAPHPEACKCSLLNP